MSIIQELENSIDIVELVGKFTRLKKTGANYKALCPFPGHSEKTPSFVVSPSKQLAYCFGCHRGGGPLKFIMDVENTDFKEALDILKQITGRTDIDIHVSQKDREEEKSIYALHNDIVKYYENALKNNKHIRQILVDRGITEKDIEVFHLGFSDSGVSLYQFLIEKGYSSSIIEESKVFLDIQNRKDKFIGRIIFPIQNPRGDFVGFAGRVVDKGEPKYLNSPTTKIYDKSSILYGFHQGKKEIIENDFVIICEGYMDVIALQRKKFKNAVCVSGTALTEKQIEILKRLTNKFYLCFDNDSAGQKATRASIELIKNKGIEIKIISLSGGKDPDELIKAGVDFQSFIDNALSPIAFSLQNGTCNIESLDEKRKFLKEILVSIKSFEDLIEQDFYLKEVSRMLDIHLQIVYDTFNKIRISRIEGPAPAIEERAYTIEENIMAYMLIYPQYDALLKDKLLFMNSTDSKVCQLLEDRGSLHLFDIDTKERIRGLSLQIEEETKSHNEETIKKSILTYIQRMNEAIYKGKKKSLQIKKEKDPTNPFIDDEIMQLTLLGIKLGIKT